MFAVHQALVGAVDLAPTLVGGAGDDPDRVEVIGSFYENVLEFLHVHHGGEDALVYPLLHERCTGERTLLDRIGSQHSLLDEPTAQAREAIVAWRADPSAAGADQVTELLGVIGEALRPHLEEEENLVLPIASAWISPEEWGEIPGHALRSFQADKPWLALGLIRERLTEEQSAAMLAGMPPQLQTVWTEQWEPAFTAFIGEVRQ
jgi:hemerythrin-like domain-containing protein